MQGKSNLLCIGAAGHILLQLPLQPSKLIVGSFHYESSASGAEWIACFPDERHAHLLLGKSQEVSQSAGKRGPSLSFPLVPSIHPAM